MKMVTLIIHKLWPTHFRYLSPAHFSMECGWYAYQLKTGETLFFFNKLTGQYRWLSCSCSKSLDPINNNKPWVLDNDAFKAIATEKIEQLSKPSKSRTHVNVRSIATETDLPSPVKTLNTQGTQTEYLDNISCAKDGLAEDVLSTLILRSNKNQNIFSGGKPPNSLNPSQVQKHSCSNLLCLPKQELKQTSSKLKLHDCSYCEKAFTSYAFLTKHEKYHIENNSLKKKGCAELAESGTEELTSSMLENSITNRLPSFQKVVKDKKVESSDCSYRCGSCKMLFKLLDKLEGHQKETSHKGIEYQCDKCDKHYSTFSDVGQHLLKEHSPDNHFTNSNLPYNCRNTLLQQEELPKEKNGSHSSPAYPMASKKDGRYWCYKCDISYIWPYDLVKHKIRKKCSMDNPVVKKNGDSLHYICRYCDKVFTEMQRFVAHHMKHFRRGKPPHECDECSKTFLTAESFMKHYAFHVRKDQSPKKHSCNICNKVFTTQTSLSQHKRVHLSKDEPLQNERLEPAPETIKERESGPPSEPKSHCPKGRKESDSQHKYECHRCKRKYTYLKSLIRHEQLLHHGQAHLFKSSHVDTNNRRPKTKMCYQCQVCKKSFQHYNVFYKHRSAHREEKGRCKICRKTVRVNEMSDRKCISCKKPDDKPKNKVFSCEVCGKQFLEQRSLTNHNRIHKTGHFECTCCSIIFESAESLKCHTKDHEKNSNKPKTFRIVSSQKPHECNKCGKLYTGRANLLRHKKRCFTKCKPNQHTGNTTLHSTKKKEHSGKESQNKGDTRFRCKKCKKSFLQFSELYNHFSVHGEEKPCYKCHKMLASSGNLKRHLIEVHKEDHTFYCHVCSERFHKLSSLQEHISLVQGVKKHKCKKCGQAFSLCGGLMEHSKVHAKG